MKIKEVKAVTPPYPFEAYAHVISPLPAGEGGGFLISFPDLPGCMSDGKTIEEAIQNGRDAFLGWISARADMAREIPKPSYRAPEAEPPMSGKFVQRVPKTLHAKLASLARQEGVSLNTLVLTFIAEGVGMREEKGQGQTQSGK
jgi:antitoxin HicB